MLIIRAAPGDAAILTSVAFETKRHWGYREGWMQKWAGSLKITPDYTASDSTF